VVDCQLSLLVQFHSNLPLMPAVCQARKWSA
jgi:hypothetical protein